MDSSMISKSFSRLVVNYQTTTTCSWEITSIEDTTQSRPLPYLLLLRSDTQTESPSWEEITRASKSHRSTDSMMSAWESTVMPMFGNTSLPSLITYHSPPLLRAASSASMVVFPQVSILLIKSSNSIDTWKSLMKVQSVIFCGLIQMIDAVGVFLQEVLVTLLDKISQSNSIIQMTWSSSLEHINL